MSKEITTIESYLSFKLDNETFAVNVSKVLEILEVPQITKVPKCPSYMRGVINLRGNVLPVIDTRAKFGMQLADYTVNTCIIVLSIEMDDDTVVVGALVDSVQEVIDLDENMIQPSPSIGSKYRSEFIKGMAKVNEQFMMVLDIDHVFSSNELLTVQESTEEGVV